MLKFDSNELRSAMRRALDIAKRGPVNNINPRVGCVILSQDGQIIAEGWHMGSGSAHAEVAALNHLPPAWRSRASELTAIVTLEPCNHQGQTGPCAKALADFGVGAVVYSVSDPGETSGGGEETLRLAGVKVTSGILSNEGKELIAEWQNRIHPTEQAQRFLKRPHITVKWAQSLDGRIAASDHTSQWITGAAARQHVHEARARHDAILIGTGTLLADDPALTARDSKGDLLQGVEAQPFPVVIGKRQIPEQAKILSHPALGRRNLISPVKLLGRDLADDMSTLLELGFQSVYVEGGSSIISSLLKERLVDEVHVYTAPLLLGGKMAALSDIGVATLAKKIRLEVLQREQLGDDLFLRAKVTSEKES